MNESIESIKSRNKNKRMHKISGPSPVISKKPKTDRKTKYFRNLITRSLIAIIFVLGSVIFVKYSNNNLLAYKKYILNDSLSFTKINSLYQKYLGGVLPFEKVVKDNTKPVFNEKLVYKSINEHHNGSALNVGSNYMVPAINSGIVVFIGEKDNYNKTVIVQGVDGVDIWYGNLDNINLKLYDYIEKGSLVGESKTDELYLSLQKNGEYLKYEEYIK